MDKDNNSKKKKNRNNIGETIIIAAIIIAIAIITSSTSFQTVASYQIGTSDVRLISNDTGVPVDIQNPLPTNGDSVYSKDIWINQSNMYNFTGNVTDLFDNLHSLIIDNTSTGVKTIFIHFQRSIPTAVIGLGSFEGNFSNLKIIGVTSGNIEFTLLDDSGDNTKKTTDTVFVPTVGFNALKLEFYTTDTVTLSNIFILKAITGVSRIQGQKPDGSFIEFQATQGGNFKISLEEFENGFYFDPLPTQIRNPDGNGTATIDKKTNSLIIIDFGHHEIHEGDHFFKKSYVEIPSLSQVDFLFITPTNGKELHLVVNTEGSSEYTVEAYEDATISNNGTSVEYFNRNRNSLNNGTGELYFNPTIVDIGNLIFDAKKGAGKQSGGETRANNEIILKKNSYYILRMINNAAGDVNTLDYLVDWYEHTPSN